MNQEKVYALIDECRKEMLVIDENFYGCPRINAHEHEQRSYIAQFKKLNIKSSIVSNIYSFRNDDGEITDIKNNIEKMFVSK